ncbi:hypothetical protein I543_2207 [Mycobacteroides abscessus 21]|uniref:Uncharacterized protein n=1 Tax=Mycobacteroides abscessus 21 TaxID=1299324 RepID=A0A829PY20_9MYCO|nr:hypothetical protein I543_2207 [Mycobacteroides abscessus 21]
MLRDLAERIRRWGGEPSAQEVGWASSGVRHGEDEVLLGVVVIS